MKSIFILLLLASCAIAENKPWWQVLPATKGYYTNRKPPKNATEEEIKVIQQTTFTQWTSFENDYIQFEFPQHPLIKLEVKKSDKSVSITNGTCSPNDSFGQRYTLKIGKIDYARFYLQTSKKIDHITCFCRALVYHAYKVDQGTLTCFSMLAEGKVKTAQIFGGGLKLSASEWTHLACPASIYERMISSMRIKTADPEGDGHLRSQLIQRFGADAQLGLISHGAKVSELITAFGKPTKQEDTTWTWEWVGKDYPLRLVANIENGIYLGLVTTGIDRDHAHPVKGSIPWCQKIIYQLKNPNADLDALDPFEDMIEDGLDDNQADSSEDENVPPPFIVTNSDKALVRSTLTAILEKGPEKTGTNGSLHLSY